VSYSRYNSSTTNKTTIRTPKDYSPVTGICTVCIDQCPGPCEIGQSAIKGPEVLYPTERATSQAASEKDYPVDFSHLNINGRCFGAFGTEPDQLGYSHADLSCEIGMGQNKIKLKAPYIFPAMAKLNWQGYYGGAALAGVMAVIGEDMPTTDPEAVIQNGKVVDLPRLKKMHEAFYRYSEGYGALFIQANPDDDRLQLLEYAITKVGFNAVELKMAQAAKGIQGMGKVPTLEKALELKKMGYDVQPDPEDAQVQQDCKNGSAAPFYKIGRLPDWNEEWLIKRVKDLRSLGAKFVALKTGPFRTADTARFLIMASKAGVDLVTVDTAGGGTGNSPIRMMNEWGYPAVYMQRNINEICEKMTGKGMPLPAIAIAGGFAFEDQIFKGLALGSPHTNIIGIGRAAMAAAMVGETVGLKIQGLSADELGELAVLKGRFGKEAEKIPAGAIGVYNYVQKTNTGLQQLMALCRTYTLDQISRKDLVPLTKEASRITGIPYAADQDWEEVDEMLNQ
jgi:glutamate synthase domain-containing protein 2